MPCIVDPPNYSYQEHLEIMLCKACRFLNKEQMLHITSSDNIYCNLLAWCQDHVLEDYHGAIKSKDQAAISDCRIRLANIGILAPDLEE